MTKKTLFALEIVTDTHPILEAYFVNQGSALDAAKHSVLAAGGYGFQVSQQDIVIYETAGEWLAVAQTDARGRALAKLTSAERSLLGLI